MSETSATTYTVLHLRFKLCEDKIARGERFAPSSGLQPFNTIVWKCRFYSLAAAEKALKKIENSPQHTELAGKQPPLFQES